MGPGGTPGLQYAGAVPRDIYLRGTVCTGSRENLATILVPTQDALDAMSVEMGPKSCFVKTSQTECQMLSVESLV